MPAGVVLRYDVAMIVTATFQNMPDELVTLLIQPVVDAADASLRCYQIGFIYAANPVFKNFLTSQSRNRLDLRGRVDVYVQELFGVQLDPFQPTACPVENDAEIIALCLEAESCAEATFNTMLDNTVLPELYTIIRTLRTQSQSAQRVLNSFSKSLI